MSGQEAPADRTLRWRVEEAFRLRVREPLRRRWTETVEEHGPRSAEATFAVAERLARVTHRDEQHALPAAVTIDDRRIDTLDDLQAFTELPHDVLLDVLVRRKHLSFRAEWLATPEPIRTDHWFYLSSKTYLLNNATHHDDPTFLDECLVPFVPSGGRVLDFGGGSGELSLRCVARGYRAAHLELNALQRDFVRFRVHRHGLADRLEVHDPWVAPEAGGFDAVFAMDVLEHLPAPGRTLEEQLLPALTPGGVLIESSPFMISSSNPMHHADFGLDAFLEQRGFSVVAGRLEWARVWRRQS